MTEKTSGEWTREYVRLQEELNRVAAWVEERGITEDQRAERAKAAQSVFKEAVFALNRSVETWAKEFVTKKV